jgi:hypothetical protein
VASQRTRQTHLVPREDTAAIDANLFDVRGTMGAQQRRVAKKQHKLVTARVLDQVVQQSVRIDPYTATMLVIVP